MEIWASGQYKVDDVASRLAVSRRTLQRHLRNEGTSFQQVLDGLREELARHYLAKSEYSFDSWLLDIRFFRQFQLWQVEATRLGYCPQRKVDAVQATPGLANIPQGSLFGDGRDAAGQFAQLWVILSPQAGPEVSAALGQLAHLRRGQAPVGHSVPAGGRAIAQIM